MNRRNEKSKISSGKSKNGKIEKLRNRTIEKLKFWEIKKSRSKKNGKIEDRGIEKSKSKKT